MAKQINFEYKGKKYCLEYTRATVKQMETEGFIASEVATKPMNSLPRLFAGAFKAHHRHDTKQKTIDEIFDSLTNKSALVEKLAEMYAEPIESLMDDCGDEKNATMWDATF